jgi:hypothetical protein
LLLLSREELVDALVQQHKHILRHRDPFIELAVGFDIGGCGCAANSITHSGPRGEQNPANFQELDCNISEAMRSTLSDAEVFKHMDSDAIAVGGCGLTEIEQSSLALGCHGVLW